MLPGPASSHPGSSPATPASPGVQCRMPQLEHKYLLGRSYLLYQSTPELGYWGTRCKKEQDTEGTEHVDRMALSPELCWNCTPELGGLMWGLRKWRCQLRGLRCVKCSTGELGTFLGRCYSYAHFTDKDSEVKSLPQVKQAGRGLAGAHIQSLSFILSSPWSPTSITSIPRSSFPVVTSAGLHLTSPPLPQHLPPPPKNSIPPSKCPTPWSICGPSDVISLL